GRVRGADRLALRGGGAQARPRPSPAAARRGGVPAASEGRRPDAAPLRATRSRRRSIVSPRVAAQKRPRVGTFRIDREVASVERPGLAVAVGAMLVDSGSELTWIPASTLERAGVRITKQDERFLVANGESVARSIGYAIVQAGGFETVDEVVFALPGDLCLLGARTLEGFDAVVDARRRCLVAAGPHPAAASG